MSVLGLIALVMLTLLGYSGGTVLAGREKKKPLDLTELGMAVLLLAAACWTGSMLGKWKAIPICMILSGFVSMLMVKMRGGRVVKKQSAGTEFKAKSGTLRIWNWWKSFSADMGNFQGRLLLAFFYFMAVTPFALVLKLSGNPLKKQSKASSTFWIKRDPASHQMDNAREQF
jgi:hypothetical protein